MFRNMIEKTNSEVIVTDYRTATEVITISLYECFGPVITKTIYSKALDKMLGQSFNRASLFSTFTQPLFKKLINSLRFVAPVIVFVGQHVSSAIKKHPKKSCK